MSFDIQGYFNNTLPQLLAKSGPIILPGTDTPLRCRAQMSITGPAGGSWLIDLTQKPPICMIGVGPNPDITVSAADTDFAKYMANPSQPIQPFFFSGRFALSGNTLLIMGLQEVFKLHF